MRVDLAGRRAVVTGAAHGIGGAIVRALADAGAEVHACDLLEDPLHALVTEARTSVAGAAGESASNGNVPAPGPIHAHALDVSDRRAVGALVDGLPGAATLLVHAAGGVRGQSGRPIEDVPEEDWHAIFAANLDGAFFLAQALAPAMKRARHGRIVHIASGAGLGVSLTGIQAYASAKAGLIGLTRQLAHELGAWGITVNAIAPGFIRSNPTTERQWQSYGDEGQRRLVESIALRRLGQPEDIAHGVLYFLSEQAAWVSGQTLAIDGGR